MKQGDTISALATNNTVIVKGHPAHPNTCELVSESIIDAVKETGMPNGTYSMLNGVSLLLIEGIRSR
jgi:2,5-dioxopentanoate dehydrogenase